MQEPDKYVLYKNIKYYRLTDLTGALGLIGRTYGFNMAVEQVGAKIVKVPGFGNSYFLSEPDAQKVEQQLLRFNQDGGERVDASTGQTVQKVIAMQQEKQNNFIPQNLGNKESSQQLALESLHSQNGLANQNINPQQTDMQP